MCIFAPTRTFKIHSIVSAILSSVVPFIVLLSLNSIIIYTMRQRSKEFGKDAIFRQSRNEDKMKTQGKEDQARERQLTIMLVLVSVVVLVLTLPTYLYMFAMNFIKLNTPAKVASDVLAVLIVINLYTLNNAINFFLYALAGRKFRQDLLFICGQTQRKTKQEHERSTTLTEMK